MEQTETDLLIDQATPHIARFKAEAKTTELDALIWLVRAKGNYEEALELFFNGPKDLYEKAAAELELEGDQPQEESPSTEEEQETEDNASTDEKKRIRSIRNQLRQEKLLILRYKQRQKHLVTLWKNGYQIDDGVFHDINEAYGEEIIEQCKSGSIPDILLKLGDHVSMEVENHTETFWRYTPEDDCFAVPPEKMPYKRNVFYFPSPGFTEDDPNLAHVRVILDSGVSFTLHVERKTTVKEFGNCVSQATNVMNMFTILHSDDTESYDETKTVDEHGLAPYGVVRAKLVGGACRTPNLSSLRF